MNRFAASCWVNLSSARSPCCPRRSSSGAAAVGRAYAWNTFGAIVGAIAAGFWLLPCLGSFHLLAVTAGANLVLATVLSLESAPRSAWKWIACGVNLILLAAAGFIG